MGGETGGGYPRGAVGDAGLLHAGIHVTAVEAEPLVLVPAAAAGGSESEGEGSTAELELEAEEPGLAEAEAGGGGWARTASGLWVAVGATVQPRCQSGLCTARSSPCGHLVAPEAHRLPGATAR